MQPLARHPKSNAFPCLRRWSAAGQPQIWSKFHTSLRHPQTLSNRSVEIMAQLVLSLCAASVQEKQADKPTSNRCAGSWQLDDSHSNLQQQNSKTWIPKAQLSDARGGQTPSGGLRGMHSSFCLWKAALPSREVTDPSRGHGINVGCVCESFFCPGFL